MHCPWKKHILRFLAIGDIFCPQITLAAQHMFALFGR